MYQIAAILAAGAMFMGSITLFAYVIFRFYSLAISYDSALLRELRSRPLSESPSTEKETLLSNQIRQFMAERQAPTEGAFEVNTDEELYLQEQVKKLRDQGHGGISEEELKQFVSQAASETGG